jgi:hypothetical protein
MRPFALVIQGLDIALAEELLLLRQEGRRLMARRRFEMREEERRKRITTVRSNTFAIRWHVLTEVGCSGGGAIPV